ncbi:peptidase M15 [Capybara microvirus Cap1_SP_82]|nr:peptidase M15 [Capybara microvirus Cap1_SP_82]
MCIILNPKTQLSEHFSLTEMVSKNDPCHDVLLKKLPVHVYENLKKVCSILEEFRKILDCPISVNSALRSTSHNIAVGGVTNSYHCHGLAVDFRTNKTALSNFQLLSSAYNLKPYKSGNYLVAKNDKFKLLLYPTFIHMQLQK